MRIVWSVMHQQRHRRLVHQMGPDEVSQFLFTVMCRAVQTYNPERGAQLATHVRAAVEWQCVGLYARKAKSFLGQFVNNSGDPEGAVAVFGYARPDRDIGRDLDHAEKVRPLLDSLTTRQRQVIELYYGFVSKPHDERSIAKLLGVSRTRVYQARKQALVNLWRTAMGMAAVT